MGRFREHGTALWAAAEDAVGYVEDGSVQLIVTSPPYPLLRQKAYGNASAQDYLDWFVKLAASWPQKLTPDGSIVLNLGDVWEAGQPTVSVYQERLLLRLIDDLGWQLCQRFAWQNPSKLPAPAEWVTIRRVRVKPSLEQVFWLTPANRQPYADNRMVLTPYSARMQARLAEGGERAAKRPSGYEFAEHAFAHDNGGAIPGSLITAPNTVSNDRYLQRCREEGLPAHPARFPAALPEFFIKFLTRPGDIVADWFGGSSTTGEVAERLGRRWITCDRVLAYVLGSRHRFPQAQLAALATAQ
jgi:DNA modification methylase